MFHAKVADDKWLAQKVFFVQPEHISYIYVLKRLIVLFFFHEGEEKLIYKLKKIKYLLFKKMHATNQIFLLIPLYEQWRGDTSLHRSHVT